MSGLDQTAASLVALAQRLRDQAAAPAEALHAISAKEAAYILGISEASMRRRCEDNPFGDGRGYGLKVGGRWLVVFAPFIATVPVGLLHRVSRG